jgi:hypothetical protein
MKLSPPKMVTWIIALILLVLALLGYLKVASILTQYDFWLAVVSAALMLIATQVKGL